MKKLAYIVEILVGVLFILNTASDIQLGFGLVLNAIGINSWIK